MTIPSRPSTSLYAFLAGHFAFKPYGVQQFFEAYVNTSEGLSLYYVAY
jgi:hypothetical protein